MLNPSTLYKTKYACLGEKKTEKSGQTTRVTASWHSRDTVDFLDTRLFFYANEKSKHEKRFTDSGGVRNFASNKSTLWISVKEMSGLISELITHAFVAIDIIGKAVMIFNQSTTYDSFV